MPQEAKVGPTVVVFSSQIQTNASAKFLKVCICKHAVLCVEVGKDLSERTTGGTHSAIRLMAIWAEGAVGFLRVCNTWRFANGADTVYGVLTTATGNT